jgi:hypothetical protein
MTIAKQPSPGKVHGLSGGAYAEHTVAALLDAALESSRGQRVTVLPVGHDMVTPTVLIALTNQIEFSKRERKKG